jgi:hypothetical protein
VIGPLKPANQMSAESAPVVLSTDGSKFIPDSIIDIRLSYPTTETEIPYNSWIGVYYSSNANTNYINYFYLSDLKDIRREGRDAIIPFHLPSKPGIYNFRYFETRQYDIVAQSDDIHVGPLANLTLTNSPDPHEKNNKLMVEWELLFGDDIKDGFIVLFAYGNPLPIHREKVNSLGWMKTYGLKPIGKVCFSKPRESGKYFCRMYTMDEFCCGTSPTIDVIDKLSIKVKSTSIHVNLDLVTTNVKPFVGVYNTDTLVQSSYIDEHEELEFHMKTEGDYLVKLFLDELLERCVFEEKVTLIRKDRIEVSVRGNKVIVGLYIDTEYFDWSSAFVALYKVGSDNFKFEMYSDVREQDRVFCWKKVPFGKYTVRFFQNNSMFEEGNHLETDVITVGDGIIRARAKSSVSKEKHIRLRFCEAKMLEIGVDSKVFGEIVFEGNKVTSDVLSHNSNYIWDQDFEITITDVNSPLIVSLMELDVQGLKFLGKGVVELELLKKGENEFWFELPNFLLHVIVEPLDFGI